MIGPLRRRHAWLAPGAFLVAAVGLAIGVAARPTEFVEGARALDRPGEVPSSVASRLYEMPGTPRISFATYPLDTIPKPMSELWIVAHERIEAPDVLAYAVQSRPVDDVTLPPDAVLLGSVRPIGGTRLRVDAGDALAGRVVLFSLGQQRIVRTIGMGALTVENR